ncbi:MAG: hypothetical protein ACYTGN_02075 [Planctomycetota bacterium]
MVVLALLLLAPAQTIAGKYVQHSEEYLRAYPAKPVPLPRELPADVEALCALIEAGHATPQLFAALGDALVASGDKRLAYRAYDKAHRLKHPDPRTIAIKKDDCPRVSDDVIRAEESEARIWVDALQSYERDRLRRGLDPRDLEEFHERYGRPEDDLAALIRARRLVFVTGMAGVLLGVGFGLAARGMKKRFAAVPLVAAAGCLVALLAVGTAGPVVWGAGFALAGAAAVAKFGK